MGVDVECCRGPGNRVFFSAIAGWSTVFMVNALDYFFDAFFEGNAIVLQVALYGLCACLIIYSLLAGMIYLRRPRYYTRRLSIGVLMNVAMILSSLAAAIAADLFLR